MEKVKVISYHYNSNPPWGRSPQIDMEFETPEEVDCFVALFANMVFNVIYGGLGLTIRIYNGVRYVGGKARSKEELTEMLKYLKD